jgi:hypothetical protein
MRNMLFRAICNYNSSKRHHHFELGFLLAGVCASSD